MTLSKKIGIEHKELGLSSEILPETLSAWEERGWTPVDDEDSAAPSESVVDDEVSAETDVPGDPDDADEE